MNNCFIVLIINVLNHFVPVQESYKNQLVNMHFKLIDWFLYDYNTGH